MQPLTKTFGSTDDCLAQGLAETTSLLLNQQVVNASGSGPARWLKRDVLVGDWRLERRKHPNTQVLTGLDEPMDFSGGPLRLPYAYIPCKSSQFQPHGGADSSQKVANS